MPLWLVTNPIATALGALLLILGVYTTALKFDNYRLTTRNVALEQAEKRRVEMAASALRDNKAKEATDKKRSKQIEVEYARSKKTIDALAADNRRLVADIERLRHGSSGDPVSSPSTNTALSIDPPSPADVTSCERILVEAAQRFDTVREQLLGWQKRGQ